MSDIQRKCPQCQATLEVPEDSVGRSARCPACNYVFEVTADPSAPPMPVPPSGGTPSPSPAMGPPTFPTTARTGGPSSEPTNPYAPINQPAVVIGRGVTPIEIRTASAEQYINATWNLFKANWQPLVGVGALLFVLNIISAIVSGLLSLAAQESGNSVFVVLEVTSRILFGIGLFYLSLGLIQICLDAARGRPISFGQVFQVSGKVFGFSLVGYFAFLVPCLLLVVPVLLTGVVTQFDPNAMLLVAVLCIVPAVILIIAISFLFWTYLWMLVDRETGLVESFRLAYRVGTVNKLNTLILMLLSMGISGAGACACLVGQIATTPGVMLLASVAFLMMTGQQVFNPEALVLPHTTPQPSSEYPA